MVEGSGIVVVGSGKVVVVVDVVVVGGSVVVVVATVLVVVGTEVEVVGVVLVVGGRVVVGLEGRVVVVGRVVVGDVGAGVGLGPGGLVVGVGAAAGVVVVVVAGGRAGNPPVLGAVVVTGPNTMVVDVPAPAGIRAPPPGLVVSGAPFPSPWSVSAASTGGAPEEDRSRSQLAPAKITSTPSPAVSRTIAPEMSRPTRTLSRNDDGVFSGARAASRSAICLARSLGVGLFRPLVRGNRGSFLPPRLAGS